MLPEAWLDTSALWGFVLSLARVAGLFVAIPIPGAKSLADPARVLFTLALTVGLAPAWPRLAPADAGQIAFWLVAELSFGLGAGMVIGIAAEALVMSAQALALQAGFSYASMIDPSSHADSSVLQVLSQIAANLLFFSLGMDHMAVRAVARSLETFPPGMAAAPSEWTEAVAGAGSAMLEMGLRLALPVVGLLLLTDLCLALSSRLQAQLQLLSLAFPLKMLIALAVLASTLPLAAWAWRVCAGRSLVLLRAMGVA
ncbi:MAG: flagellar biosynthetic protein FliR [Bryobacteraceae bacterium]|nr:MAG: flagellar biosynthetic protein FliR [Bryobacteraceae bacterium]